MMSFGESTKLLSLLSIYLKRKRIRKRRTKRRRKPKMLKVKLAKKNLMRKIRTELSTSQLLLIAENSPWVAWK